ncbi:HPP family protein [Solihabitans fulvus]|uniref:HPP family protein n=1 Tax=Solihabitans fulvus TaxID=1892852 RepID=UPI001CB75D5C|nr:HPP family protein [Solihabitans fulvus]
MTDTPPPTVAPQTEPATRPVWWKSKAPASPKLSKAVMATVVGTVMLLLLALIGDVTHQILLTPPFAASAVIIAGSPALPPAQPRSVIGGQLASAVLGLLVYALFGASIWTAAIAGGVSLGVMIVLRVVHAPAAALAALVVAQHPEPVHALVLVVAASVLLVLFGVIAARLRVGANYPAYWW